MLSRISSFHSEVYAYFGLCIACSFWYKARMTIELVSNPVLICTKLHSFNLCTVAKFHLGYSSVAGGYKQDWIGLHIWLGGLEVVGHSDLGPAVGVKVA